MSQAQKAQVLATSTQAPLPAQGGTILDMIERVARDPNSDVEKMRQLLDMRAQFEAKEAEKAFDEAMTLAQSEMQAVAADSNNPQTKSKYASYYALDRAVRPIYTKHQFALSFGTAEGAGDQMVRVTCRVSRGGHSRNYQIDMPADGKGAKGGDVMTRTHATGSAVSYGMRYLLKMIFNLAVGEAEDDGNQAGANPITTEQVEKIKSLIVEVAADISRFCKYFKVARVEDIAESDFNRAISALEAKRAQS